MRDTLFFLSFALALCTCFGARILGIFPVGSKSHYILGSAYMKSLAEAGHDVTIMSAFSEKEIPRNGSYREIVLEGFSDDYDEFTRKQNTKGNDMKALIKEIGDMADKTLSYPKVQKLLHSKTEKFDLVVIEQHILHALKGIAYHFNAPHIVFSATGTGLLLNSLVGNPAPPSYIPELISGIPRRMNFFDRVRNTFSILKLSLFNRFLIQANQQRILKKHFPNAPSLEELNTNVSLVLLNSHISMNDAVPLVPSMIEIGGFHIKPKKLSKDLQILLDDATEGVIYFSMGSVLKSSEFPKEKLTKLLNVFSKLEEKVLWKWDGDDLVNKPSNVVLSKWLPQQDVLGHPNIKLFITHAGSLSVTETIFHGVPILSMPVCGDQFINAENAKEQGFGLTINHEDFSEEILLNTIQELLMNPKYTEKAKTKSKIMHDRPTTAEQTAVYWTEYVIRHKGAPHLRVAGVHLPLYQYLLLDVFAFIGIIGFISLYILKIVMKQILYKLNIIRYKSVSSTKKNK